ncbi:hypothetical protein D3C72_1032890 [compost metagenome]
MVSDLLRPPLFGARLGHHELLGLGFQPARGRQVLRGEGLLGFIRAHQPTGHHDLGDGAAFFQRLFDHVGRLAVADQRVERGGEPQALHGEGLADRPVGLDALYALLVEDADGVGQNRDRREQVMGGHRHHHVQLELAGLHAVGDRGVLPQHLEADLVEHLHDARVDLARHDRAAGLHRGQDQFVEARRRPGGQQPEVVGDAGQLERQQAQSRGSVANRGQALHRLEEILGRTHGQTRQPHELLHHLVAVLRPGVQARASGRAADAQLQEALFGLVQPVVRPADGAGVGAELLAHGHRHRVLQVGAARLDHVGELGRLGLEAGGQALQRVVQRGQDHQGREAHGRGNHVIGGLAHVDVVVGMDVGVLAQLATQQLVGPVGDHLVGVHVEGRPGPGLVGVHHEVVVVKPQRDLARRLLDRPSLLLRQVAQLVVRPSGGDLDGRDRPHHRRRQRQPADGEVAGRPKRLNAVIGALGQLELAQRIALGAE